jgi:uncharacterized protein (UPF0332 family)
LSKGAKRHPPKKKHSNRPRPELIAPLTEDERRLSAQMEFAKAIMHLEEAEAQVKAKIAPNACAHSAYYAMYHCAAASILAAGGVGKRKDVPASHTHVIEHFAKIVETEGGALAECGPMLSRAQTDRDVADYNLVKGVTQKDAAALVADARRFVEACNAKWKLR